MIENLKFNTAISQLMVLVNVMYKEPTPIYQEYLEGLIKMLSVFSPYISEEMWHHLGHDSSIVLEPWPQYDQTKLELDEVTVVFQVNGKIRGSKLIKKGLNKEELISLAKADENVQKFLEDKQIIKEIAILDKIVNLVVK